MTLPHCLVPRAVAASAVVLAFAVLVPMSSALAEARLEYGSYRRVDNRPDGLAPARGSSAPAISADGRFSAFTADRDVLGGTPRPQTSQVYLHDAATGRTTLVSHGVRGRFANAESYLPSISDDGRYVVYTSAATNLTGRPAPEGQNVYRFDTRTATNRLITTRHSDDTRAAVSSVGQISGNGRYVAFSTDAALVADDINDRADIYRWDSETGRLRRVTATPADGPAGGSFAASVSNHGQVAFLSDAAQLTPDTPPSQGNTSAYVWNPVTSRTTLISTGPGGEPLSPTDYPKISDDGRYVTYPALSVPSNRLHLYSYPISTRQLEEITAPQAGS